MINSDVEILLAENNINNTELTIRALSKNKIANHLVYLKDGASVPEFLFGEGKLKKRDISEKSKLILFNFKMPKVDGLEVLRVIKTDEFTKTILPVVIFTSSKENPGNENANSIGTR